MQALLSICEQFAQDNDMIFNAKKTVCMCLRSKRFSKVNIPNVQLCGRNLEWVQEHKYLGVFLNCDLVDDQDIKRQIRCIYMQGATC